MRAVKVAEMLSKKLGVHITLSRMGRYEERGILPPPPREGKNKNYRQIDIDNLEKIIILSELGVSLSAVRQYLRGFAGDDNRSSVLCEGWLNGFKRRIKAMRKLLRVAGKIDWEVGDADNQV